MRTTSEAVSTAVGARLGAWCAAALLMVGAALLTACGGGGGGDAGGGSPQPVTPVVPVPPVTPPETLASAPTRGSASLVMLSSDAGDYIGAGLSQTYDTSNARIRLSLRGAYLRVQVDGRESWSGDFQLPREQTQLAPGTYAKLSRYPFQTGGAGGLSWTGNGRGCNTSTGSVTIHEVRYRKGLLQALDLSFEQHCEGAAAALRGQIRVDEAAMASVMAPANPLPDQPVIALNSDSGDYIGVGAQYGYDHSSAAIDIKAEGGRLTVNVKGDESWMGDFQLPEGVTQWAPGSYAGLQRYPFGDRAKASMSWSGEGRGCNALSGSLVVKSARYEAGVLKAIDLDFEQHCEGGEAALRGQVRWDAATAAVTTAPQSPAPAGLWTPPAGAMPDTGNAVYLESTPGDYIGGGWTWWVGAAAGGKGEASGTATLSMSEANGLFKFTLTGDGGTNPQRWLGEFKAMDGLAHLQPGYYGIVKRFPFQNPRRGGMSWSMNGNGCNVLSGWFVVDSISYQGDQLAAIDLRFAQYCENSTAPLRGRIRWTLGSEIR